MNKERAIKKLAYDTIENMDWDELEWFAVSYLIEEMKYWEKADLADEWDFRFEEENPFR